MIENNYKVRLIPISSLMNGENADVIRQSQVVFDVTPSFTESGSVDYAAVTPVHMPGSVQIYKHTNSRTFEITAHFISRNVEDALKNMKYVQKLRSWRLPYFGKTTTLSSENDKAREDLTTQRVQDKGVQLRGAPPDILYLYAYSNDQMDGRSVTSPIFSAINIARVPVVLTNLGITYPDDVDYIPVYDPSRGGIKATNTQPFPIKMDVTLSLAETHSPNEFQRFDLAAYKNGNLVNF